MATKDKQRKGVEIDCPKCGNTAIVNDCGVYCPNCTGK